MSNFDPGVGWHKVTEPESSPAPLQYHDGMRWHYWARDEPVPPLPTEPYTVIRALFLHPAVSGIVLTLENGRWGASGSTVNSYKPDDLANVITGFEVLAEPSRITKQTWMDDVARARRETAKAVLERVRIKQYVSTYSTFSTDDIAQDFGVER